MSHKKIAPLFDGPLDIVGDVHGEIEPLKKLLRHLDYDSQGAHPDGRRLVFVGDLCDRGPDSPGVIELVQGLVERDLAQCLAGNHELNILRSSSKPGNRWFLDPDHEEMREAGEFWHSLAAPDSHKPKWLNFFASLPLALEREDLRVVHAAWVPGEIAALRRAAGSTLEVYRTYEEQTLQAIEMEGLHHAIENETARWHHLLEDRNAKIPLLTATGECEERHQMGNPVRVATSGVERLAREPFWSNGKWRMCDRVRWWDEYEEAVPVVVGHYWRQLAPVTASSHASSKPQLFGETAASDWLGAKANVFCVDFSVGARYQERKSGVNEFGTRLAALRWPERELWFETGRYQP